MKISKVFDNTLFFHGLFAVLITLSLLPYYAKGGMVLGGEGHYILDFKLLSKTSSYAWIDLATGISATSFNFNFFITFFFSFLETILKNSRLINFLVTFAIFYLPFFSMFNVVKLFEKSSFYTFLIAFFYIVNPFTLYSLSFINIWNYLTFFMVPMGFWFIVRFYNDPRFFLFFGLFTAVFAFTNANPPLLLIFQISLIMSTAYAVLLRENKFTLVKFLKKYSLVLFSFALFNIWWILIWLQALSADIPKMYTSDFAVNYAQDYVRALRPLPLKIFSFTGLIPLGRPGDIFLDLYNTHLSFFVTLIPVGILIFSLLQFRDKCKSRSVVFLLTSYLILIFMSKGPAGIFGFLYKFALIRVPFFSVFKSPVEKWGVLLIFVFSLLLIHCFSELRNIKQRRCVIFFFAAYLIFCSVPLFKASLIPNYVMNDGSLGSRKFHDKIEYKSLRKELSEDAVTYRILSLPGSLNYQVALDLGNRTYYTGMDPVIYNTGRQFIAPYSSNFISSFNVLFNNFSKDYFSEILRLFNVGKIVINKNMLPWFGYMEKETPEELSQLFSKYMSGKMFGNMEMFDAPDFLPRLYSADTAVIAYGDISGLIALAQRKLILKKPFILFSEYNNLSRLVSSTNDRVDVSSKNTDNGTAYLLSFREADRNVLGPVSGPNIVFKRVNPTKYIVQIENAQTPFWLIFLESYHKKWNIFLGGAPDIKLFKDRDIVADYPDLSVKESRSMEKWSLRDTKYLFTKSLDTLHLNANGYANAWLIDPQKIKQGKDITLVIYYLTQSYAYLGFLISGFGFLGALFILTRIKLKSKNE